MKRDPDKTIPIVFTLPSGNPYASINPDNEGPESYIREATTDVKRQYLSKLQDPYAQLAIFNEGEYPARETRVVPEQIRSQEITIKMSKADFERECRRIFSRYMPARAGRVLRSHHRDFIARNLNRSPEQRYLLTDQLRKYDLASTGNYKPYFNREDELFTAAKLEDIESFLDIKK